MIRRYAELRPDELTAALNENPLVICPWGALEWHGAHLPLGLDGLVAEAFCERLAAAANGILLPNTWLPITTLPHPHSLCFPTEIVCAIWRSLFDQLVHAGAKKICLISGHYAQGHELELYRECREAMTRHPQLTVLAAAPLELLANPDLLDHAGHSETAQLLALRPDLVRLDLLQPGPPADNAVLGADPRTATDAQGEALLADALNAWLTAIASWSRDDAFQFFNQREAAYSSYKAEYFQKSWEQAIADWWTARSGNG